MVPSVNGWADLEGCLTALQRERDHVGVEVLVAERCGDMVRAAVARQFPWVRVLPVSPETTIPQMRARCVRDASAPTVAVIEDHVLVPPGWARAIITARAGDVRVLGGGVENAATERTVDWAAFLCEYSHLLSPQTAGASEWLTGNNTAYDRTLLLDLIGLLDAGRWEDAVHASLREQGVTLWARPDIVVGHKKHYTVAEYTSQRYLYARAYAAARAAGTGVMRRVAYGAFALALPPVLLFRIVNRVWATGRHRGSFCDRYRCWRCS